ncbi:MAG: DUF4230 domain-containing protein, partial [Verrucomicrobia bacterium]|nr:DUF4230 domain-containing protein [Verrucomicrobiota bacterium]
TQVVELHTGLLRQLDKNLEQDARRIAIDDLQRAARHGGILDDAAKRARLQLAGLCRGLGFTQVEFRAP